MINVGMISIDKINKIARNLEIKGNVISAKIIEDAAVYIKWMYDEINQNTRTISAMQTAIDRLREEAYALEEALQWAGAASDFQVGGKAREGWLKLCEPLLETKDIEQ